MDSFLNSIEVYLNRHRTVTWQLLRDIWSLSRILKNCAFRCFVSNFSLRMQNGFAVSWCRNAASVDTQVTGTAHQGDSFRLADIILSSCYYVFSHKMWRSCSSFPCFIRYTSCATQRLLLNIGTTDNYILMCYLKTEIAVAINISKLTQSY